MTTPLLAQLNDESTKLAGTLAELLAKRQQLALAHAKGNKVKPLDLAQVDADIAQAQRQQTLIADARKAADAEDERTAEADAVRRLEQHVAGALELAEARVDAAAQVDRVLNDLMLALGTFAQLGAGAWEHVVRAGSLVDPDRLPEGILQAHGFALGSIDTVLSGLASAVGGEPRLRTRVDISGFTDPVPSCQQRAVEELGRLRGVLVVHASPAARQAAKEARARASDPVEIDLRAAKLVADAYPAGPTYPSSLTVEHPPIAEAA